MINLLLCGVGGQGSVLAAKVLAQAAHDKGWHVRTAETIGMAQRGGCVTSHIRMGNAGETLYSPLLARGSADIIIAFEPAEGARALSFLAPQGSLLTAQAGIQPVEASLQGCSYIAEEVLSTLAEVLPQERFYVVDTEELTRHTGDRKTLNTVMLAAACMTGTVPFSLDDLRKAIKVCIRPRFIDLNLCAIDSVEQAYKNHL